MKGKKLKGKVYIKLLNKLFLQTFAVLAAATVLALVLRDVLRGRIADILVDIISRSFGVGWTRALGIYQHYIRNNLYIFIGIAVVVFFLILIRLFLSWFTRYFDQIVTGVDQLANEKDEKIEMSPELKFMEVKLNEVKDRLKMRRKEAQDAEQKKNDLVVYLAHDIKTPLTSVIGYLTLLDDTPDMPIEYKAKYTHIALDKAYRLESLINEFFEITRYNYQAIPLKKERVNLCYMMVQIADELYPQLIANGKEIKVNISDNTSVFGDPEKLARVFNNILKNAIAYGEKGSEILIEAAEGTDKTLIKFISRGSIPEDKLNMIFEKFYRLDAARSSGTGGAGLGLAIAKEIVTAHGGVIRAESGGGNTVFIAELPSKI